MSKYVFRYYQHYLNKLNSPNHKLLNNYKLLKVIFR